MRNIKEMGATRRARTVAASGALVVAMAGLAGCSDSAGPEAGEVTTEDLTQLEEQAGALEERVGVMEEGLGLGAGEAAGEESGASGRSPGVLGH